MGLLACVVGLALAAVVQVAGPPAGPPLYDGVVSVAPYKYLQPAGTEAGGALGATLTIPVLGGTSPAVVLATPEQPPQAQLIAGAGALVMPAGATSLVMSITPVAPAASPSTGTIAGNDYRIAVTDQAGAPVSPEQGRNVTLALRDPGSTDLARIELLSGGTWQPLATVSAAVSGTYETTGLTSFGDVALVGTVSATAAGTGVSPFALVTAVAVALALLAFGVDLLRGRRRAPPRDRAP